MRLVHRHIAGLNRTSCLLVVLLLAGVCGSPAQEGAESNYVNFSFDGVGVRFLVKLVGDMTGRQFVVDDAVEGKVTVVTPPRIPVEEVYPLFLSILEANGYSVIQKGSVHHVVALPEQGIAGAPVETGAGPIRGKGIITKVIKLEHVNAVDLVKTLEPLVRGGKAGAITAFGPTNHLIITDTSSNIQRIVKIIAEIDKAGSARAVEVVALKYASAEDIARQITTAMIAAEKSGAKLSTHMRRIAEGGAALPSGVVVVPAPHANSLVVVGTIPQISELKRVVKMLDTEGLAERGPLNAIFLKYLSAEEAAKSLNALLEKTTEKNQRRRIAIEANLSNNALIVHASPRDFEWVKALVDRLDQMPQQVLVEILIAEIQMGKDLDLGVEWSTIDTPVEGRTTVIGRTRPGETDRLMDYITQGIVPRGLAVGVAKGTYTDSAGSIQPNIPFLLHALAQNRDVKILSRVPLWAQDNTEASVSVVENIPILKSTIEGGAGTARDTIQNIDRIDVGIKLRLTPHVNPNGEIQMELNPSIEAIINETTGEMPYTPTIAKREVSTTVTVPDKATIAISGLIREDRITVNSKIPLLGDIPLLGVLFRSKQDRTRRTNLMIFVTPHIVTDMREAAEMRRSWENRTGLDKMTRAGENPSERE